jgi:hypothetical protein
MIQLCVTAFVLLNGWMMHNPAALAADPPKDTKNLLPPAKQLDSWRFEQHESAKGNIKAEGDGVALTVTETDGTEWHVQAARPNLELKDGKQYTLAFKAKADADRTIQVNAMIDQDDWHPIGLNETPELTKDWKTYEYTFTAENVAGMKKNRITLVIGNEKGTVLIKDMTLTEK